MPCCLWQRIYLGQRPAEMVKRRLQNAVKRKFKKMKLAFSFFAIVITLSMTAQNSWQVYLGKKQLLNAELPDEEKNRIVLTGNDLRSKTELVVAFHESGMQKDWIRIFSLAGNNDTELMRKEGVRMLKITTADLNRYFKTHRQIKIYTWSLPPDPGLAAGIRVRRVHLCTIGKE